MKILRSRRFAGAAVATAGSTVALAAGFVLDASAATPKAKPPVSAHAIFDDGAKPPFRVGQIVMLGATRGARSPGKITKVCFSPAPIARPACGKAPEGAPSAVGTTKVTVSFSKHAPYVLKLKILPAATKVGGDNGGLAVPATVTCPSLALYGNVGGLKNKSEQPLETVPAGTKVALYNVLAPNAIAMVNYATGRVGIAEQSCATPGI